MLNRSSVLHRPLYGALRCWPLDGVVEAAIKVSGDFTDQIVDAILEEMVSALHHGVLDKDALLGLQLLDQAHNFLERRNAILIAVDEQARRGAWGEEREIETVCGRRNRDEALDFGAAHQQLHADP